MKDKTRKHQKKTKSQRECGNRFVFYFVCVCVWLCFLVFVFVGILVFEFGSSDWYKKIDDVKPKQKTTQKPRTKPVKQQRSNTVPAFSVNLCFLFGWISGRGFEATRTQTNKDTQMSMQFRQSLWIFVDFVVFWFFVEW